MLLYVEDVAHPKPCNNEGRASEQLQSYAQVVKLLYMHCTVGLNIQPLTQSGQLRRAEHTSFLRRGASSAGNWRIDSPELTESVMLGQKVEIGT